MGSRSDLGQLNTWRDHLAVHVGQPVVPALVLERQLGVVDPQAMQDRGVQVMDVDGVASDVVAEVVGRAVSDAGLDAAAAQPDREAARMVVAAVIVRGQCALAIDGPAEFAAPDDQRVVEQAALLEVRDEGGRRLIGIAALAGDLRGQVRMLVPAAVEELDEAHAPFGQPARQQAVGGEGPGLARVGAVQVEDVVGLAARGRSARGPRFASGRPSRTARCG